MKDERISRLHRLAILVLVLLAVQFVLGMTLNLFTTFPNIPGGIVESNQFLPLFTEYPVLLVHYSLGVILFIFSIVILIFARGIREMHIFPVAMLGFFSVLAAFASGIEFMVHAFQNNTYSFTMSIGFIVALLTYFAMFYETKPLKT